MAKQRNLFVFLGVIGAFVFFPDSELRATRFSVPVHIEFHDALEVGQIQPIKFGRIAVHGEGVAEYTLHPQTGFVTSRHPVHNKNILSNMVASQAGSVSFEGGTGQKLSVTLEGSGFAKTSRRSGLEFKQLRCHYQGRIFDCENGNFRSPITSTHNKVIRFGLTLAVSPHTMLSIQDNSLSIPIVIVAE